MTKKATANKSKSEVLLKQILEVSNEVFGKNAKVTVSSNSVKISLAKIAPKKKVGQEALKNPQLHFTLSVIEEEEGMVCHIKPRGCGFIPLEVHKKDLTSIKAFSKSIIDRVLEESMKKSQKFFDKKLSDVVSIFEGKESKMDRLHLTDMESAIYHSCPGESRSALVKLEESYLAYEYYKNNKKEPSKAMIKGSAFHALVLEPENFEEEVIVDNSIGGTSSVAKMQKKIFEVMGVGKTIINAELYETVKEGRDALMANPIARTLLKYARSEESFFWTETHKTTGIETLFKCRPDGLIQINTKEHKELLDMLSSIPSISGTIKNANLGDGDVILFDLKFTADLSERKVTRNAYEQGYFFQGAHYSKGVETVLGGKVKLFFVINVQSDAPYDCSVELFDESCLAIGEVQRNAAINTLCFHKTNPDAHKGVNDQVRVIAAPEWALTKTSDYLTKTKGMIAQSLKEKNK